MSYKWTLDEVDAVEMPMLFCLLDEIGEIPPADFLAVGQLRAQQAAYEREKRSALDGFGRVKGKVRRRTDGDRSG